MQFKLDTPPIEITAPMDHQSRIVLLGSCFSDNMYHHFRQAGFEAFSNPFGTIYHPGALAFQLANALRETPQFYPLQSASDAHHDWMAAHKIQGATQEALQETLFNRYQLLGSELRRCTHLFITFGTAWGYRLKTSGLLVANCHKQPASSFDKILSPADGMAEQWREVIRDLRALNPELNIIFTVSPVRHIRDGMAANNRAKARLFEVLSLLEQEPYFNKNTWYFPSYEIVIDELRDYRFFERDLVHPNALAVEYVRDRLYNALCPAETQQLIKEVLQLRAQQQHRPVNQHDEQERKLMEQREKKIQDFLAANPDVVW